MAREVYGKMTVEQYDALCTPIDCPVCGRTFRFYAAIWIIGRDMPYCSKRCALIDGCDADGR